MHQSDKFESYYHTYRGMVYSLCLGYVKGDADQASDLCQEVFVKVWGALPGFEERASPKTWIYRIAVNCCLLHLRTRQRKPQERLQASHEALSQTPETDPTYSRLYAAIGQLAELDRVVILMVLEELEYTEIAAVLGITENNLRVKISRIKQRLNTILTSNNHGT